MIMNQYKNYIASNLLGCGFKFKDTVGTERSISYYAYAQDTLKGLASTISDVLNTSARGVMFLNGGSEPKVTDYTIDGTPISGLSATNVSTQTNDETGAKSSIVYTLTNTSDADVTIDQVCLIVAAWYGSSKAYRILADRTKLDAPVTIPAGGVGQVTYEISVDYLPTETA